jgi:(S)-3,5-dihydroxyphenylglycine transaminase
MTSHDTVLDGLDSTAADHAVIDERMLHASLRDPLLDSMNFLNQVTFRYPDAISFAPGRPFEGFFELADIHEGLHAYVDHLAAGGRSPEQVAAELFQYGPTAGSITDLVARYLDAEEGIAVSADAVVVTVGAQEAMLLALRTLFAGPEDVLLVAAPSYVGITGAARILDVAVHPVPWRDPDDIAAPLRAAAAAQRAMGRRARAFYLVPDHANPTGHTLTLPERHALLEAAADEDLLVVEDSPYRLFTAGRRLPTLKALDRGRRVLHIGSFAKSAFPGARLGYAVADQVVRDAAGRETLLAAALTKIKSMVTVNTPSLSQAVVGGMLLRHGFRLAEANERAIAHYARNLERMLAALARHFPPEHRARLGVSWNEPDGGFFLTVRVGFPVDEALLRLSAEEFKVIWTPMRSFEPGADPCAMRLSYSSVTPADIDEGIARLAALIAAAAAR